MRYLILSDIHANIDALEAVLAAAPADTWDRAIVLGDLVGYGAEPSAVIERVLSEVLSNTLQVRLQIYNYCAFMADRRPETISVISGTGVIAPAGF